MGSRCCLHCSKLERSLASAAQRLQSGGTGRLGQVMEWLRSPTGLLSFHGAQCAVRTPRGRPCAAVRAAGPTMSLAVSLGAACRYSCESVGKVRTVSKPTEAALGPPILVGRSDGQRLSLLHNWRSRWCVAATDCTVCYTDNRTFSRQPAHPPANRFVFYPPQAVAIQEPSARERREPP